MLIKQLGQQLIHTKQTLALQTREGSRYIEADCPLSPTNATRNPRGRAWSLAVVAMVVGDSRIGTGSDDEADGVSFAEGT